GTITADRNRCHRTSDTSLLLGSLRNYTTTKQEYPATGRRIVFSVADPTLMDIQSTSIYSPWFSSSTSIPSELLASVEFQDY
ncbi:hypothetical protein Tco_0310451, partial [Tanacetum coccineum]